MCKTPLAVALRKHCAQAFSTTWWEEHLVRSSVSSSGLRDIDVAHGIYGPSNVTPRPESDAAHIRSTDDQYSVQQHSAFAFQSNSMEHNELGSAGGEMSHLLFPDAANLERSKRVMNTVHLIQSDRTPQQLDSRVLASRAPERSSTSCQPLQNPPCEPQRYDTAEGGVHGGVIEDLTIDPALLHQIPKAISPFALGFPGALSHFPPGLPNAFSPFASELPKALSPFAPSFSTVLGQEYPPRVFPTSGEYSRTTHQMP
ncbi:hypothetical protein LTR86_002640 [Recurvomyces mirabilis]|nr:hypothetical protein LTR86_002640 [Recurvomyces mirabilis]